MLRENREHWKKIWSCYFFTVDWKPCWWKNNGDDNSLRVKTVEMLNMLRVKSNRLVDRKPMWCKTVEILWQCWLNPTPPISPYWLTLFSTMVLLFFKSIYNILHHLSVFWLLGPSNVITDIKQKNSVFNVILFMTIFFLHFYFSIFRFCFLHCLLTVNK